MYRSHVLDGLFVITWGQTPEVADVPRYVKEIQNAAVDQGWRLFGLGIVPEASEPPSEAFRAVQAAAVPAIAKCLYAGAIVFEGSGVYPMLKRTAFSAMTLLIHTPCPIYVRASVEDALIGRPPAQMRFDGHEALATLKRLGAY